MGFQESTGTATVNASVLTLANKFSVGDTITITAGTPAKTGSYTVSGNDLISGDEATILSEIAKNMADKLKTDLGQSGITVSGAAITFTTAPVAAGIKIDFVNKDGPSFARAAFPITASTMISRARLRLRLSIIQKLTCTGCVER